MSLELYQALNDTMEQAFGCNEEARRKGLSLATANARLRALRAQEELKLKRSGMPVTLIHDAVYASEEVNHAAMLAEVAQSDYDTEREAVLLHKREADILREQIAREWSQAGSVV